MMKFDVHQLNELIRNRRSFFTNQFTGEKVNDSIIEQMLENANWAPTHGLTEPWRFIVFAGEGVSRLAQFQSELYKKVTTRDGTFDEKKYENLKVKPLKSSHVIAIGMMRDERRKIREIEEIEAVACAVENMYLTATAYGIGCYWGTGGITYFEEAKAEFGLDKEDKFLGFMFVGVPAIEWPSGKRTPIEDKVTWVRD